MSEFDKQKFNTNENEKYRSHNLSDERRVIQTIGNNEYAQPTTISEDYADFVKEVDKIISIEEGLENDFQTTCLYHKLQFEDGMCAFYTFASIVISLISYEGKKTNIGYESYQIFTLVIVSIFNLLFCKSILFSN